MQIDVSKEDLVATLKANRDEHRAIFEKAFEGYRKRAVEELEKRLDAIRDGKPFDLMIGLVMPEDHTADYDTAICMAEMVVGATVSMSERDFRQYIEDDWGWKHQFIAASTMYSADR